MPDRAVPPIRHIAGGLMLVFSLSGCMLPFDATMDSLRARNRAAASVDTAKLAPKFSYLRITHPNGTSILGLDRLDPHPDGPIQVWQSVAGEVLRIQNGRLVGASGLLTEWRGVRLERLPSWSQVAASSNPTRWTRQRDVMPGYRYDIHDELVLGVGPPPGRSALREVDVGTLTWFEERRVGRAFNAEDNLPVARYAVRIAGRTEIVVYGEQCLSPKLCITWQRWSAEQQDALREKLARTGK